MKVKRFPPFFAFLRPVCVLDGLMFPSLVQRGFDNKGGYESRYGLWFCVDENKLRLCATLLLYIGFLYDQ